MTISMTVRPATTTSSTNNSNSGINQSYEQNSSPARALTAGHLMDTITILSPRYWHLSPCWGAVVASNGRTAFLSNLLKFNNYQNKNTNKQTPRAATRLAQQLFFQPHPGAAVRLGRSKSLPVSYVTPSIMAHLLGISVTTTGKTCIKDLLLRHCNIKSNYVDNSWTGVSLARWMEIVECLAVMAKTKTGSLCLMDNVSTSLVWDAALWQNSASKHCWLQYFLTLEQVWGFDDFWMPENDYAKALKYDASVQEEWANAQFTITKLADRDAVEAAMHRVLLCHPQNKGSVDSDCSHNATELARALELLCAFSTASGCTTNNKPIVPNGYYGYDGGKAKPDCVEVAIRELLELLFWNEQSMSFDNDVITTKNDKEKKESLHDKLVSFYHKQNQQGTRTCFQDNGKEWFDLLQNLPGCDYLSESPRGTPYELAPTMLNVARVCHRILSQQSNNDDAANHDWTSLKDLEQFWNDTKRNPTRRRLQIALGMHTERAPMSHELLVHEVATVSMEGAASGIELRLRCDWARNTGFATVTHLRLQDRDVIHSKLTANGAWDINKNNNNNAVQHSKLLQALCDMAHGNHYHQLQLQLQLQPLWCYMLPLILLGDCALKRNCPPATNTHALWIYLISSPYGMDRRMLMDLAATTDMEREEWALAKTLRESKSILKTAIQQTCARLRDSNNAGSNAAERALLKSLLGWILAENPNVSSNIPSPPPQTYDADIEKALWTALGPKDMSTIIGLEQNHWACRSLILLSLAQWKTKRASTFDIVQELGPSKFMSLLWLNLWLPTCKEDQ